MIVMIGDAGVVGEGKVKDGFEAWVRDVDDSGHRDECWYH